MNSNVGTASDEEIEVSVDLANPVSPIVWRKADSEEDKWQSTPYQSNDVRTVTEALKKVSLWLDASYRN